MNWIVFTICNHEEEVVAMPESWLNSSLRRGGDKIYHVEGAEVMQENEARERADWIIGPEEMRREKGTAEEVFFYVNQVWTLWDAGYISDDGALKAVKGGEE